MNIATVEVSIGQGGDAMQRASSAAVKKSNVAGLTFYEASDIVNQVEPIFRFKHPTHSFELPKARSVMMTAAEKFGDGIEDIAIDVKIPDGLGKAWTVQTLATYDKVLFEIVYEAIKNINNAGFKRYISLSQPRTAGIDTYFFNAIDTTKPSYSENADPNLRLTFDAWQTVGKMSWSWYADNVFVNMTYYKAERVPGEPVGDNGIRVTVQSAQHVLMLYAPKDNVTLAGALSNYEKKIPLLVQERLTKEAGAKSKGLKIMRDWIDPSIGGVVVPKH